MAHLQDLLIRLEPVLLLLAAVAFFKSGSARKLPALTTYFITRGISLAFLQFVFFEGGNPLPCDTVWYAAYFYGYWVSYIICAVILVFVVQEIFKSVMQPVPGLRRLGLIAFRWITIVSFVVAIGAISLPATRMQAGINKLSMVGLTTMRCVSVIELCMLAFLALTVHALGRSFRSRLFGIGLGFGLQASMDLVTSAFQGTGSPLLSAVNGISEVVTIAVLITWTVYFLVPEPLAERKLIVLPPNSPMARWNALANGLGQMPEPVTAAPTGFFLQDIEGVVDRVLAKNPVAAGH